MKDHLPEAYEFGPFRFDVRGHMLSRQGKPVPLTPKAADLLLALLESNGQIISKHDVMKAVWPDTFVTDGNLTFHIHLLRQALGDHAEKPQYIENLPRRGYRFIAHVSEVAGQSLDAAPEVWYADTRNLERDAKAPQHSTGTS